MKHRFGVILEPKNAVAFEAQVNDATDSACGEVIKEGGVDLVLREFAELCTDGLDEAAKTKVAELVTYFQNNQARMDYPTYLAQGLRISSGIVESANYHVTGARLKQQGMRWSETGAAEIATLRADLCSGNWDKCSRVLLAASRLPKAA